MTSPPPTSLGGLVRHLGPGFIITATIVGSGELIVTPKLGASVGFSLLWFIIARLRAEGVRADPAGAHRRGHRPHHARRAQRAARPALAGVVDSLAVAGDVRVAGLPGQRHRRRHRRASSPSSGIGGGPRAWALPVGVSCALLLASGRYSVVERGSTWMVAAFTLSAVVSVGVLQSTPYRITGVAGVERPAVHAARQLHRRVCRLWRDRRRRVGADLLPLLVSREGLRASRRSRRRRRRLGRARARLDARDAGRRGRLARALHVHHRRVLPAGRRRPARARPRRDQRGHDPRALADVPRDVWRVDAA